jgi:hypothetical protein
MIALLIDPWFEAKFYGRVSAAGECWHLDGIDGAQGVQLWCPCGYGKPEYPLDGGRPHACRVPFANPRNAPMLPPDHGPQRTGDPTGPRPRWQMAGTGLGDLTCAPSIAVGSPECWHGFIVNGEVR